MKLKDLHLPDTTFAFAADREEAAVILQGTLSEELKTDFGKSLAEVELLKMEKLKATDTEDWELDHKYTETYMLVLDA